MRAILSISTLRQALSANLGQVLTPEVAAVIEGCVRSNEIAPIKPMIEKVQALENSMKELPQVDCPVRHYFSPGMYAREITIPKGTIVVGAIHKTENLVVVSKGRLRIVSDESTVDVEAPYTMVCKAGSKNAVAALEDSVWTNFFPTTETDPDKLVELLTFSKHTELLGGIDNAQLISFADRQALEN